MIVAKTETRVDAVHADGATALSYRLPADRALLRAAAHDRDLGHRFVASRFPDDLGGPPLELWRIGDGEFTVVSTVAPTGFVGTPLPTVGLGERLSIAVTLEAVARRYPPAEVDPRVTSALLRNGHNPPSDLHGGRRVRVPDAELPGWVSVQLTKAGLEPAALTEVTRSRALRRGATMHLAEVAAAVTVTDAAAANLALATGIGRGRAFGAGLIEVTDVH
ncbi:type I-E CRISPR-associated protein Cas6/Cse3/CasE [Mycobacterium koreense]|uniref:type I-E CRISPR-associated protein Cas6/Cse3/CasE n=1 Tax=Mycolicibacillus koreensis TaxID=1069220 RepID=UPI00138D8EE8|nr:type I-E CRISPR-associated protein Cas6/Cse3/CasE [Mycolicibacillus koreensis]MCV7247713.1 type I-E CRISPR-associated protein Cas6/Cse3/CasE [Mycolicibacillus koreensis]BBY54098.1 hypothetical protein MKOR_13490 [Mycolicibacillus koreensis]